MAEKRVLIHNKSDRPDNVIQKENDIFLQCEAIERELPRFLRGFYAYLRSNVLPNTRLAYLHDIKFFMQYLIDETDITDAEETSKIKLEDLQEVQAVDVNMFIDYCRRYKTMDPDADIIVVFGGTNDFGHGDAPLGEMSDRTVDTFYGALHTLYTSLITRYPEAPIGEGKGNDVQTYSLDWDLNYIIIAIMNQFGIDLTYRRKEPFHWWEFLLFFRALSGNHFILRLMEIRGYDGKDADMKRQAQRYALPRENDADDKAMSDAFNELFYNA